MSCILTNTVKKINKLNNHEILQVKIISTIISNISLN